VTEPHLTRRQREDPMVIAWLRAQEWLEANARLLAILAGAVLLVVVVAVLWTQARARAAEQASVRATEMSALYWRGEYARVLTEADAIRKQYPGTLGAADAARMKADASFWQGDFKQAAQNYEVYLEEVKTPSPVRSAVRRNLAQALEGDKQSAAAAKIYEELGKEPGPRLLRAENWLSAGRAWRAAGDSAKAIAAFRTVSREFTDTPFAANAEVALGELNQTDL
jgi:tetratricopeptide (TPR) repeat protein